MSIKTARILIGVGILISAAVVLGIQNVIIDEQQKKNQEAFDQAMNDFMESVREDERRHLEEVFGKYHVN